MTDWLEPGVHLHLDQLGQGSESREIFGAWTAPRTYTAGEVLTASILNQHVRDNFLAVQPGYLIASGSGNWAPGGAYVVGAWTASASSGAANDGSNNLRPSIAGLWTIIGMGISDTGKARVRKNAGVIAESSPGGSTAVGLANMNGTTDTLTYEQWVQSGVTISINTYVFAFRVATP